MRINGIFFFFVVTEREPYDLRRGYRGIFVTLILFRICDSVHFFFFFDFYPIIFPPFRFNYIRHDSVEPRAFKRRRVIFRYCLIVSVDCTVGARH